MGNKAIYAVLLCALIAGTNGILIKSMPSLSTGTIAWFRTAVPVLFLIPFLWQKKEFQVKGDYKHLLLASTVNTIRMYLYLLAFIYTSIGNAVVLFYSYPLFVTAIEILFYNRKIRRTELFFIILAFIGILITYSSKPFSFESDDFVGMIAALGAAIGYAVTVLMFKTQTPHYSKNQLILYQNIVGAVLFIPFLFLESTVDKAHLGIGVLYGFIIGIVVFRLFFFGLKYLPAATATSLMYLEVLSAIVLGYLILGETLTWHTFVGGSLILISSFFITRINKKAAVRESLQEAK